MALGNINDIAAFVAVVRAGSFTTASAQLGLGRSAVGKSIARLEDRLGVRLLNRTPRSLSPTDEGQLFFAHCTQLLEDLQDAEAAMAVRSAAPSGALRLTIPVGLGHRHAMPVVQAFLKQWPAVHMEVSFTDRFVDLIDEGFDIALRIGEPRDDSRLITRTVARQKLWVCASPEYLAAHGTPRTPADLASHECIFFMSGGRPQTWHFTATDAPQLSGAGMSQMDSAEALVAAAVNGLGIVNIPTYLLDEHIRAGRLSALLREYAPASLPIRVVYPTRRHLSPKVRLFIDLLAQTWGEVPPWERNLESPDAQA